MIKFLDKVKDQIQKHDKDYVQLMDGYEGAGKCQPAGSKVLMADGSWKNIEDVRIGDKVISPQKDGTTKFASVLETTNWYCDDVYDIIAINKKKKLYSCSGNHLIPINYKHKNGIKELKHVTPKEIINNSKKDFRRNNKSLVCPPIKEYYGKENCIIEPYTLGAMLGDGCMTNANNKSRHLDISSADEEIIKEIEKTYVIISVSSKKNTKCKHYRFSVKNFYTKIKALSLYDELKSVGLMGKDSGTKFIPEEALLSDINYRKRLLAGIIDTDGYKSSQSGYEITLKSKQLIEDIKSLVHSLGGLCGEIRKCKKGIKGTDFVGEYFRFGFNFNYEIDIPCKIIKKRRTYSSSKHIIYQNGLYVLRSEKTKPCQVYGFEISEDSHWYITDNFQVTHNSTLAQQQGKYVDPTLDLSRVCMTADEFKKAIMNAEKGNCVIYDEAVTGLSAGESITRIGRLLKSLMMQMRQKNLYVIIILPSVFEFNKYAVLSRARSFFHAYENKSKMGYWIGFNRKDLRQLYLKGKKTHSYMVRSHFKGRFYGKYTVNDEEYRKKKEEALEALDETDGRSGESKFAYERKIFLANLYLMYKKAENITQVDFCKRLLDIGVEIKKANMAYVMIEARKLRKLMSEE